LIVGNGAVGVLYIMALENHIHDGDNRCYIIDWSKSQDIQELYEQYTKYRVTMGIVITAGLITTSIVSIKLLKKFFQHTFNDKIKHMVVVLTLFGLSYAFYTFYDLVQIFAIHSNDIVLNSSAEQFVYSLVAIYITLVADFLPILCVFILHYKNYGSDIVVRDYTDFETTSSNLMPGLAGTESIRGSFSDFGGDPRF
jgi:hypothetical protein